MKKINLIEWLSRNSHEKQKPQRFARYAVMLIMLLTLGVGQMWAGTGHSLNYPYFYFYNDASWTDVQAIVGRDWTNWNHSKVYPMGKSANVENLYFVEIGDYWNDDYNQIAVLTGASAWGSEDNNIGSRWTWCTAHSDNAIYNYDMSYHNTYYWGGKSASSIATSVPTYATTLKIKVKTGGSSSYSDGSTSSSPASSIKITGTYADGSGDWGTKRSDASWSTGSSCTYNTVISGKVTVSYSSLNSGWQFDGWYIGGTRKSTSSSYSFYQTSATEVEARFSKLYTVTYNANGSTGGSVPASSNHASSTTVTVASNSGSLAKTNYTFGGWNKNNDASGTNYAAGSGTFTISGNTTLYAKWTQGTTLNANGGSSNTTYTVAWNAKTISVASVPTRTGYTLTGYSAGGNIIADADKKLKASTSYTNSSKQWTNTGSAPTMQAEWQAKTYSITLDREGATTGSTSVTMTYNSSSHSAITLPTKTGYDFEGYWTGDNGTGSMVMDASGVLQADVTGYTGDGGIWTKDATCTLYAQWTPKQYTVTLTLDLPTASYSTSPSTVTVTYQSTSNLTSAIATPYGGSYYLFGGYYTAQGGGGVQLIDASGNWIKDVSPYTNHDGSSNPKWVNDGGVTLYAKWTRYYSLRQNDILSGETAGGVTLTYNSSTLTSFSAASRNGYDLDGYYSKPNGSGGQKVISASPAALYNANGASDTIVQATTNKFIYTKYLNGGYICPHWTAHVYTISFDADDASRVGTATNVQGDVTVSFNNNNYSAATVAIPVLNGYTFGGYFTSTNGSGKQLVNESGVWQSDKASYTDASGNWIYYSGNVTLYAKWTPKNYTVTYDAGSNGGYILGSAGDKPSTTSSVAMGDTYGSGTSSEIYVSAFPTAYRSGYTFDGWYTNVSSGDKVESTTQMATAANHTLYAHFTQRNYVYFYNNLGWSKVFVTYNAYWSEGDGGTGNYGRTYHEMERIGETNVYRDEIPAAIVADWSGTNGWIAFNDKQLDGGAGVPTDDARYGNFNSNTKVIHRRDFDSYATMFVPNASATVDFTKMSGGASYYCTGLTADKQDDKDKDYRYINKGYWMRYNDKFTGYVMKGSWDSDHDYYFRRFYSDPEDTSTVTLNLAASTSYTFMLYKHCTTDNYNNSWFSASTRNYTITSSNCTDIVFNSDWAGNYNGSNTKVTITTTTAGDYTFKLATGTDGVLKLTVDYPAAPTTDDYRVKYSWNDGSAKTRISETKHMPNINSYPREITMFLHKPSTVTSESLKIQKWNGSAWTDVYTYEDLDDTHVPENGVYVVRINSVAGSTPTGQIREAYTGEYFVRADVTAGGWDKYTTKVFGDNSMRYTAYSLSQTLSAPYSHYYCLFVDNTSSSVAYTVATEYSPSICDTLTTDAIVTNSSCHLPAKANVRFAWNEQTNELVRSYLKSAAVDNSRFLVLHGKQDDMIFKSNGDEIAASGDLEKNELQFEDKGDWIYELELQAKPASKACLIAEYNGSDRYLIGDGDVDGDNWMDVLGGTGSTQYVLKGIYDFKTNRLMLAWTPTETAITDALNGVDMLWVRYAQNAATQITFGDGGSLKNVKVVAAIELKYNDLVGKSSTWNETSRPYLKYMISFPFDVNISDIFGLNGASYGNGFIIQKYNGEERAERGYFTLDEGFWQDMLVTDTLKATEGYCLMFDNDYTNNASNSIWEHKTAGSSIYLYFPAADKIASITNADQTESTVAPHLYTKDKSWTVGGKTKSHKDTDSHWNMIGSPLFHNSYIYSSTNDEETPTQLNAYYAYDMSENAWDVKPTSITGSTGFNAMFGIMVQWHGTIKWNAAATSYTPSAPAARKSEETKNYLAQLDLIYNDGVVDNTYVEMKDGADTAFVLCEDLNKITKASKSNVYLFAGDYEVGYSQVPIENVIIPVGVIIRRNGTHTFSMPSNFSGTVTLIDTFDGTRTNLALEDYTVELTKGTINERFLLEININQAPTAIDGVEDGSGSLKDGKAHKFIMNDQMYILKDGVLYDARGARVK